MVQRLRQIGDNAQLDAGTRERETSRLFDTINTVVDRLNQSSARMTTQERRLQQLIEQLTQNAEVLGQQLNQAKDEIQQFEELHRHGHDVMRDEEMDGLRNQVNQLSTTNDKLYDALFLANQRHQLRENPMPSTQHERPFSQI